MQKNAKIRRADKKGAESCLIFSEKLYQNLVTWHRKYKMEIKLDYMQISACRTYNSKEENTVPKFKVAKDRLILLLGVMHPEGTS